MYNSLNLIVQLTPVRIWLYTLTKQWLQFGITSTLYKSKNKLYDYMIRGVEVPSVLIKGLQYSHFASCNTCMSLCYNKIFHKFLLTKKKDVGIQAIEILKKCYGIWSQITTYRMLLSIYLLNNQPLRLYFFLVHSSRKKDYH